MGRLSSSSGAAVVVCVSAASQHSVRRTHTRTFQKLTPRPPLKGSVSRARARVHVSSACYVSSRHVVGYAPPLSRPRGRARGHVATESRACHVCLLCHAPGIRPRRPVLRACAAIFPVSGHKNYTAHSYTSHAATTRHAARWPDAPLDPGDHAQPTHDPQHASASSPAHALLPPPSPSAAARMRA